MRIPFRNLPQLRRRQEDLTSPEDSTMSSMEPVTGPGVIIVPVPVASNQPSTPSNNENDAGPEMGVANVPTNSPASMMRIPASAVPTAPVASNQPATPLTNGDDLDGPEMGALVNVPTNVPAAAASSLMRVLASPIPAAPASSNQPASPANNEQSEPDMMMTMANLPAETTPPPTNTYMMADVGTVSRPSQPVQTDNEITRNEYDDSVDVEQAPSDGGDDGGSEESQPGQGVLVSEINTPVVNTQELGQEVAQASGQGTTGSENPQLDMFPLSTALALEIIGVAVGVIGIGLFLYWYVKRSRRRRARSATLSSEKGAYLPGQEPPKPKSDFRKTFSSLASTLKGSSSSSVASRFSRGGGGAGTTDRLSGGSSMMEKKTHRLPSWSQRLSRLRHMSNEPVELPDISTCPHAYTNHPAGGVGGGGGGGGGGGPNDKNNMQPCEEEIPIGLSAVSSPSNTMAPPMVAPHHNREGSQATTRSSSSVMIMYVKSWLPGGGSGDDSLAPINNNNNNINERSTSVRASSTFHKGSVSSAHQRVGGGGASPYDLGKQDNTLGNSQPAWHHPHQRQQQQNYQQPDYYSPSSKDDHLGAPQPPALHANRRFSWASTVSSSYSDMEDLSVVQHNTTTITERQSTARIAYSPQGPSPYHHHHQR